MRKYKHLSLQKMTTGRSHSSGMISFRKNVWTVTCYGLVFQEFSPPDCVFIGGFLPAIIVVSPPLWVCLLHGQWFREPLKRVLQPERLLRKLSTFIHSSIQPTDRPSVGPFFFFFHSSSISSPSFRRIIHNHFAIRLRLERERAHVSQYCVPASYIVSRLICVTAGKCATAPIFCSNCLHLLISVLLSV